jgi:hypothetical protein
MVAANPNTRAPSPAPQSPEVNGALDEALAETFPASDPVAMLEPTPADAGRPVVTQEVEARQAVTGHNVRYVLGFGLVGIVVAFVIIYLIYNA